MKLPPSPASAIPVPHLRNVVFVLCFVCVIYLIASFYPVAQAPTVFSDIDASSEVAGESQRTTPLSLSHVVFGIASNSNSWNKRKEYVKLWWNSQTMRGCVFLDIIWRGSDSDKSAESLPSLCLSGNTSGFHYTHAHGLRSAIRVARVVSETVALNHSDVRWFVFGDDDTIFFPENLVKTLSKYDPMLWYYIGSNSEVYEQNKIFGFEMAFGGGGFAISYPLAKVLADVFDSCIQRYPHVYGSDSRIYSCLAELGIGLTREPGFHQIDVRGDLHGLLIAHPLTPLVSLHHMDYINPLFRNMTKMSSLRHFFKAVAVDSQRMLQKTVCYHKASSWSVSISWGYVVEVYDTKVLLPEALRALATFRQWKAGNIMASAYMFNTREVSRDPCRRPAVFFLDRVSSHKNTISSVYTKELGSNNCRLNYLNRHTSLNKYWWQNLPSELRQVRVFSRKLELTDEQLRAPRRHCCDVLPSPSSTIEVAIRRCKQGELIHPPA